MLHELQCTPGMGDALQIVALAVGEVIHRVCVPLVACTDMGDVQYTVDQRVAEKHIGMSHIDLRTEHESSWLTLTAVHVLEELQVLLDGAITIGAVGAWTCGRSFLLSNHLRTLLVDIRTSLLDEPYGKVPKLLEIVAGIIDVSPLESQPLDIVLDALDIFGILLDGVGVVETEVTLTTVFLGQSEVDGDGFGMSDVQIAIRLWWKTGLHSTSVLTLSQVIDDLLLNETH